MTSVCPLFPTPPSIVELRAFSPTSEGSHVKSLILVSQSFLRSSLIPSCWSQNFHPFNDFINPIPRQILNLLPISGFAQHFLHGMPTAIDQRHQRHQPSKGAPAPASFPLPNATIPQLLPDSHLCPFSSYNDPKAQGHTQRPHG